MVTLLFFNLFWLTLPQNATRIIGYAVARLSEIDLFLDASYADMVKCAKANPEGSLELSEFPVSLSLCCADVTTMSRDELRAHILEEASKGVYRQGWAAKGEPKGESSSFLKWSILIANFLGHKGHQWLRILLPLTAAISLLLAIALIQLRHEFEKLISLGVSFCVASLLSLLAFFAGAVATKALLPNREDPFLLNLQELFMILLRIFQRGYIVFLCAGFMFLAMGITGSLLLRAHAGNK